MKNIYEATESNKRKSLIVVAGFFLFIFFSVFLITQALSAYLGIDYGQPGIVFVSILLSSLMSLGGYYYSDKIVISVSGAKPANPKDYTLFYQVVQNLLLSSGLPEPKLYVINDSAPNAFATGRDPKHSAICATTGLLEKLNRTELEGVIAHELSHIKNFDTRLMAVVAVLVGSLALLADWMVRISIFGPSRREDREEKGNIGALIVFLGLIFAIISPILAQLIQLAISRRREFLADASAVAITKQPSGLISALVKISSDREPLEVANKATAHMYFENPFKKGESRAVSKFSSLFNTHPPVELRIKALKQMM